MDQPLPLRALFQNTPEVQCFKGRYFLRSADAWSEALQGVTRLTNLEISVEAALPSKGQLVFPAELAHHNVLQLAAQLAELPLLHALQLDLPARSDQGTFARRHTTDLLAALQRSHRLREVRLPERLRMGAFWDVSVRVRDMVNAAGRSINLVFFTDG